MSGITTRPARTGLLLLLALVGSACGHRATHEEILRASQEASGDSQPVGAEPLPLASDEIEPSAAAASPNTAAAGVDPAPSVDPGPASGGDSAPSAGTGTGGRPAPAPAGGAAPTGALPPSPGSGPATVPGGPGPTPDPGSPRLSPLVIGSIGPRTGPIGATLAATFEMLQAWVRYVNDAGGLNGHPVQLLIGDDGGDPARHRALLQEYVERRGVVAFLQNFEALAEANSMEYMSSKRIPLVGADGGSDGYYDSPLRFPQAATGDTLIVAYMAAVAQQALPQGKTKLGILTCVEVKACKRSAPLMERYGREFGFEVVYKGETSIAQPDYTAECLSAQSAGVQVLASYSDPQAFSRLAASCARQNFRPTFAIPSQALGSQHAKDPNLQGAIYPSPVFPYVVNDTPATNEFHTVMKKYLPASEVTGQHALAWAAAKLMQRGGARLAEPPTNESLLEGLWSIKDDDLGGLTPSLTFSPDRPPARLACWFTLVIENNAVVAVDNGRRSCR